MHREYDLKFAVNKIKLYTIMVIDDIEQDMSRFFVRLDHGISLYSINIKCYLNVNWKTSRIAIFVLFVRVALLSGYCRFCTCVKTW